MILQNLQGAVASGRAHDAATRVSGRSAHVQVSNGSAILRPTRRRTKKEELLERQLSLENVSLGRAKISFQIKRGNHLSMKNQILDVRGVFRNCVDDRIAKFVALLVPGPLFRYRERIAQNTT